MPHYSCQEPRSEHHRERLGAPSASSVREWASIRQAGRFDQADREGVGADRLAVPPEAREDDAQAFNDGEAAEGRCNELLRWQK